MRYFLFCCIILFVCQIPAPLNAELYSWTDENGVKHFSNDPPPTGQEATSEERIPEIPYDAKADAAHTKSDEKWQEKQDQIYEEQKKQLEEKHAKPAEPQDTPAKTVVVESEEERYYGPVRVNPSNNIPGINHPEGQIHEHARPKEHHHGHRKKE